MLTGVPTLRSVLEKSPDPRQRLDAVMLLIEHVAQDGNRTAAEEILKTIANDYSGEVVIGAAFACAHLPLSRAEFFREVTLAAFKSVGSMSTSDGAPLLRLAYIAGFQFDGPTLHRLTQLRPGENGVARIVQLLAAVSNADRAAIYRLLAFSEGLDKQFNVKILDGVKVAGVNEFKKRLTAAVDDLKKTSAPAASASPMACQSFADQFLKLVAERRTAEAGRLLAGQSPYGVLEVLHAVACRHPPANVPASWKKPLEDAKRFDVATIDNLEALWSPNPPMHHGEVTALAADNAGRLASGGADGLLKLFSFVDGKPLAQFATSSYAPQAKPVTFVAFLPDGNLVCGGKDLKVRVLTPGLRLLNTIEITCASECSQFAVTPDGKTLASCESDSSVALWSLDSGDLQKKLHGAERQVSTVFISADGKLLIGLESLAKSVHVWEIATGKLLYSTTPHGSSISAMAVAPNSGFVATGDNQGELRVWRVSDGHLLHTHTAQGSIAGLGFASENTILAVTERETTVWDLAKSPQSRPALGKVVQNKWNCKFSPHGRVAAVELADGKDSALVLISPEGAVLGKRRISRLRPALVSADNEEWMFLGLMNGSIECQRAAPLILNPSYAVSSLSFSDSPCFCHLRVQSLHYI